MVYLIKKKEKAEKLSKAQKTFNRLSKKLKKLQGELEKTNVELDQGLRFYHESIVPVQKETADCILSCVDRFYHHYKKSKSLKKDEKETLKELIQDKIEEFFELLGGWDLAGLEVQKMYEDITGVNLKEEASLQFDATIGDLEGMFKSEGIDIDLSKLSMEDDPEEAIRKMFDAMEGASLKEDEVPPSKEKKKTKKQIEKEKREDELRSLQKKGLSTIYKQLAKVLHPDLEPDPALKKEKEVLMKKLTVAYENEDIQTLLSLELDWMGDLGNAKKGQHLESDEQIKVYNSLLKEQVEEIEQHIYAMRFHPRYCDLQEFYNLGLTLQNSLKERCLFMKKRLGGYQESLKKLQSRQSLKELRRILNFYDSMMSALYFD